MTDKLDEVATEIDDAVLSAEELQEEPGSMSEKSIGKMKDALEKAQDVAEDLENAAEE